MTSRLDDGSKSVLVPIMLRCLVLRLRHADHSYHEGILGFTCVGAILLVNRNGVIRAMVASEVSISQARKSPG